MTQNSINNSLKFNPSPPYMLHLDLNSCFATIEQQANPYLRHKPIAVAAYNKDFGCILAPSVEAKRLGIKVGTKVKEAKVLCPNLVVLEPDPAKYRHAHNQLKKLLLTYTSSVTPRSIDEFVLNLEGSSAYKHDLIGVGLDIKQKIKKELGEYITVSVGIGTNMFLAKTAAGLHKPDGLDVINATNFESVYKSLDLIDLCGIGSQNKARLNKHGINSVWDFYQSGAMDLKIAFHSVVGIYWYQRLRGWEVDDNDSQRQSFNNSYVVPPGFKSFDQFSPILAKLTEKVTFRMRSDGFKCKGLHIGVTFRTNPYTYWHHGQVYKHVLFSPSEIYKEFCNILKSCTSLGKVPIKTLSVTCFALTKDFIKQPDLFEELPKKEQMVSAIDSINTKWGNFVVSPAFMLLAKSHVKDRVAFGRSGVVGSTKG